MLTRRDVLQIGAAAAAAGAALRPSAVLAAYRAPVFEMALDGPGARAAAAGWRTLPPRRAPRRFDLVGLRWRRGGRIAGAQVRARRAGGSWTRWADLHVMGDHLPDDVRAPAGTDPAWTGAADFVQFRVRGRAAGLRARFVHAGPSTPRRRSTAGAARRAQAGAPPPIIPRASWGGDSCPPRTTPDYGEVQLAFVHHTVTANDYLPEESASIVLGICRYHRDSNKWNDLGYNFLVDKYGQVFEGRAGGIDQAVVGAQAQGYNSASTGVACLGTFTDVAQTPQGMEALAQLLAWKLSLHGVPVQGQVTVTSAGGPSNRYPAGTPVTFERISGHRDGNATSCPGEALYGQLGALRARAAQLAVPVSAVSAKLARSRVRHLSPAVLVGALRFSDGASPAGRPLDIQYTAAGSAWTSIGGTTTASDGSYRAEVTVPASGLLRVVFPGDDAHPPLETSALKVTVVPLLSLALSPRRLRTGRVVAVSGTVSPSPGRVACLLERRVGTRWVRVQRKRINVRGGGFKTRIRARRAGLYRVSIVAPGGTIRRLFRATRV